MHSQELRKPDGRMLWLYGRSPVTGVTFAPRPNSEPVSPQGHLRWHPLRGEWVAYSAHRQNRTFLPSAENNPLRPTLDPSRPTELPSGNYDIAVFENLFPTLHTSATRGFDPTSHKEQPAYGKCEVVVFSQDPRGSLAELPLSHFELLLEVWASRTQEMAKDPAIQYVLMFENKGVEMGVTLHHPHGQIYAYPLVPPVVAREDMEQEKFYEQSRGEGLLENMIARELREQRRVVAQFAQEGSKGALALVPECARYPYETWVMPKRRVQYLFELTALERMDLARTLKTLLLKYDGLWNRSMPYLLVLHQAPLNCGSRPWFHLHFEITPPLRTAEKLKYLAGTELGAGLFANDCLPEEKAAELAAIEVREEIL